MSKPRIYRRRRSSYVKQTEQTYAIPRTKSDAPVPLPMHVHVFTERELQERYGLRPASDRALGVIGLALAVVALLGLAAAVMVG